MQEVATALGHDLHAAPSARDRRIIQRGLHVHFADALWRRDRNVCDGVQGNIVGINALVWPCSRMYRVVRSKLFIFAHYEIMVRERNDRLGSLPSLFLMRWRLKNTGFLELCDVRTRVILIPLEPLG